MKAPQVIAVVGLMLLAAGCAGSEATAPAFDARAALMDPGHAVWSETAPEVFWVRFETTKGAFTVESHRFWAPHGVDRFYNLVRTGFFDDSRFFRVRAGFIAQFGIPGDPAVAAVWRDRAMPDDLKRLSNKRSTMAYAMTGPDTRTTQLFINYADNDRLDGEGFAPIARVVEGMDVVDALYAGYDEEAGGGMRGGQQDKMFEGGNVYLDQHFPELDKLLRATVTRER